MTYSTFPFFHQRFFDNEGRPLAGGSLTFYVAGSTSLKSIYLDQSGTTAKNPMPLDSTGLPESQYFGGEGEYDIVLKDSNGVLINKTLRVSAVGMGGSVSPYPDPTNPGFLHWDGSNYAWVSLTQYPDPGNTGYLHYDVDTGVYSWIAIPTPENKVKTTSSDTTAGYLSDKLVQGSGIEITQQDNSGNIKEVISHDGTLKVDSSDNAGFLEDKLVDSDTVKWTKQGSGNEAMRADIDLTTADVYKVKTQAGGAAGYLGEKIGDSSTITKAIVGDQVVLTCTGAPPTGLAGGDLTGTYPDPLVKELSGLGVSYGALNAQWVSGGTFNPIQGVFSLAYKAIKGFGLMTNNYGRLYVTKDGGLSWTDAGYSISNGGNTRDISYGMVTGSQYGFAAVGDNSVYYYEDIGVNYDSNGIPLQSAWKQGLLVGLTGADICYSSVNSSWFFAEQSPGVWYISNLGTGTLPVSTVIPQGSTGNVGGVFIESNTNRIVYFERGTGRVWWAEAGDWTDSADWTEVLHGTTPILKYLYPQITDSNGVGTGISMAGLSAFAGNVVIATTDVSDESKYMIAFDNGTLPSLWDITVDGANWYGTTVLATTPCIYQMWLGSIPSHRQFIAEKGEVVYGALVLPDLANAPYLGTDAWGNVVAKSAPSGVNGDAYSCTMQVANATSTLAPNLISRSELITLFVPFTSQRIYQGVQTKFGCFMAQGGTGQVRFTLRDEQYRIIAASYYSTNPAAQVFLQLDCGEVWDPATHTSVPYYDLVIGGLYYLGILWDANGIQVTGDDAVQTVNTVPLPALKVDNLASMNVVTQLTGGSESKMRPFVRVLTKV